MNYNIIFCNDGVLRVQYKTNPLLPVQFIQASSECADDFAFWSKWWNKKVIFEEGLTVGKFFSCLEPWARFFSHMTQKNVDAFIAESRTPRSFTSTPENIDWISLSYISEISPIINYEHAPEGSPKSRISEQWQQSQQYQLIGYTQEIQKQHSLSHLSMRELTDIPLILDSRALLVVEQYGAKKILGDNYNIFSNNSHGIKKIIFSKQYQMHYLEINREHTFKEVIEGFFLDFPLNPKRREEFNDYVLKSVNEIKNQSIKDSDTVITFECKYARHIKIQETRPVQSPFIKEEMAKDQEWQSLMEKSRLQRDLLLKIGKVTPAPIPENRVYSHIINSATPTTVK